MLAAASLAAASERALTSEPHGHLIHNCQIFSPDGKWIVFDSRNDETRLIDSTRIGIVSTEDGVSKVVYETKTATAAGPGVGAATFSPVEPVTAFIHGLENATNAQPYAMDRRSAVSVNLLAPGKGMHLDARDVTSPFTPGALRGGTHAHHWSGDGKWLSFTYNDAVTPSHDFEKTDLRTVGVMKCNRPVEVALAEPGAEFSGSAFAAILVPVTGNPKPGSDEISRACEEGWVGNEGYLRPNGSRQSRAIAFLGTLSADDGKPFTEVFVVDFAEEIDRATPGLALAGTSDTFPNPPANTAIRPLTRSGGIRAPRHWVRCSPDGATIAFLQTDENGIVQLQGVSPNGGPVRQLSHFKESVDSPFTWSPDGKFIACSVGERVRLLDVASGDSKILTRQFPDGQQPRHGIVFSPDGATIAFNRLLPHPDGRSYMQICLVGSEDEAEPE